MRIVLAAIVVVHGLIHLMGFAKAFGLAALPALTQPISRPMGVVWLSAALLTVATGVALVAWPRGFWLIGGAAVIVPQFVIALSWHDAKFGTLANIMLVLIVAYGALTEGPLSFRASYLNEIDLGRARPVDGALLTEADIAHLPDPVRVYVRQAGFVGRPKVTRYAVDFRGRIRGAADAAWMPFVAEQQSFADEPTRLFLMRARMFGMPVEAYHRLRDGHASMRVKALGAFPIVDARGDEMDVSEAVTLFNDMCILAPGTLIDPSIVWESVDARTARARFTNGRATIAATLSFDASGMLADFVSDDRSQASSDGKTFTPTRFSTPVRDYRAFGPYRLAGRGEARWHPPEGVFTYGEFEMTRIRFE